MLAGKVKPFVFSSIQASVQETSASDSVSAPLFMGGSVVLQEKAIVNNVSNKTKNNLCFFPILLYF